MTIYEIINSLDSVIKGYSKETLLLNLNLFEKPMLIKKRILIEIRVFNS